MLWIGWCVCVERVEVFPSFSFEVFGRVGYGRFAPGCRGRLSGVSEGEWSVRFSGQGV